MSETATLDLRRLRRGLGCLDPDHCQFAYKNARAALGMADHPPVVMCAVQDQGRFEFEVELQWELLDTLPTKASWKHRKRIAEFAAEGIAFLMVESLTPYTVVAQSEGEPGPNGGTGIDYYLGAKEGLDCANEDDFPEHLARLEVSGILQETPGNTLRRRVNEKIEQSKKSDSDGTPAYIIVMEFKAPIANFTRRMP